MLPSLIIFLLCGSAPMPPAPAPPSPSAMTSVDLLDERDLLLNSLNQAVQEMDACVASALAEETGLKASLSPAAEVVQRAERYAIIRERQRLISLKVAEVSRINTLIQANRRHLDQLHKSEIQREALMAAEKEKAELKAKIEAMKAEAVINQQTHAKNLLPVKPKMPLDYFIYSTKEPKTLRSIAAEKTIYDDESKWQKIYEANKDKISDPDAVVPAGLDLIIPQIKLESGNGEP
jgi:ADP-ribose pyrophosphatase YjhB (NUDIX family)